MKEKLHSILIYTVALVTIGSVIIHLLTSYQVKGLTSLSFALFLILYSFDKRCKYNKVFIYIISAMWIVIGIFQIIK